MQAIKTGSLAAFVAHFHGDLNNKIHKTGWADEKAKTEIAEWNTDFIP